MIDQKQQKTQRKSTIAQIFQKLMTQTTGFQDVKKKVLDLINLKEKLTYHSVVNTQEEYLQVYGLSFHEQDEFNYINQLLHTRTTQVLDRIDQNKIIVKSTIPTPPPPPPEISFEMAQQVESVLNNIDLPLSLFKRNDNYWSHDNPKTLQVKEYIKQLHENDKKWKGDFKKKRQYILNQKNQQYHKTIEQNTKQQQKIKEQQKIKMIKKIQFIKSQSQVRKKTIDQGLQFIKKQGRPLYKKMEQQFHNKVQIPTLQQKKKKLSELKQLRRSVDLTQISQHKQKYQKIKQEHEAVKIIKQPVKISYKSHFYKSLEKSSVREFGEESRLKSLVDKRVQYAEMVKNNFKPAIDQQKSNQIAERIQEMHKRFRRVKKVRKQKKQADQDDDEDAEEEVQQQPEPEPQPEEEEQDQNQDEDDDQFKISKMKDDQYEPTNQQRYKMGLKFLQQARRRRKKIQVQKQEALQGQKDVRNKTFSVKDAIESKVINQQRNTIIPTSIENNRRIQYRNYLHQMSKTNKTIDFIDTSQIKSELTQDLKLKAKTKVESLQNKIRYVEQKAKQEEELLKHRKGKKNQFIVKKQQLDNAIIDTIKARLALMNN